MRRYKRQEFSRHATRRAIRHMKQCTVCGEEFTNRGQICSTCNMRLNPTIEISGICRICGKPFDDHQLMYDKQPYTIPLCDVVGETAPPPRLEDINLDDLEAMQ